MQKLMRKRILIPVAALAALAITAVAFAYFTSSGTGSGSATVGSASNGLTITGVTFDSTLYPGGQTTVRFTIDNTSSSPVQVGSVVADTSAGTNGITGLPAGCNASDFTFDDVTVGREIAAGGSLATTGTLHFADTASNQDACQGQTPTLNLKVQ